MPNPKTTIQIKEAPKFLAPYSFKDGGQQMPPEIAVRKEVLERLYALYKRTSFMVLHGPSGAGKTSIVLSGFLKEIKIPQEAVFYLRRSGDFLTAFNELIADKNLNIEIGALITNYIDSEEKLEQKKKEIEELNNQIVAIESGNELKNGDGLFSIKEIVTKRDEIKTWIKNESSVKEHRTELINAFNKLFSKLKTTPLLIFDQFEEIFTEGTQGERTQFGIFSQFLLTSSVPVNSLVIIEEEYFGYLDEFIEYIPKIFYNSVRLLDPNAKKASQIIEQLLVSEEGEEKEKMIEVLLRQFQLKRRPVLSTDHQEAENTPSEIRSKQKIHLPFLQIYLKAYHDHFGDQFSVPKLISLGKIDEVLENYLEELNDRILKEFGIENARKLKQEYPVIKYLKNFVSILTGRAQKFSIENKEELETNIWPIDSKEKLDLDKINSMLVEEGILNPRGDTFELAHDSLAIPISHFNIREDLHKKDFETSFLIWNQEGDQLSSQSINPSFFQKAKNYLFPKNLLSKGQYNSMVTFKNYIIPTDAEKRREKLRYWNKSRINVKKWNILGLTLLGLIIIGLIGFAWSLNEQLKNKSKLLESEKKNIIQQKKGALTGKVYEGTGEAWNAYRNDRTSAFGEIQRSFLNWEGGDPEVTESSEFPSLVSDFQNVFYSDYNEYPFYFKNIELAGGGYITQTKTRMVGDSLYILALTSRNELYKYRIDWKNKEDDPFRMFQPIKNIKHFEPYYDADRNLKMLLINSDHQVLMNENILEEQLDTLVRINGNDIGEITGLEHLDGQNFVVSKMRSLYDLRLHERNKYGMYYSETVPGEVMQIRHLPDFQHKYIVRYGRSGLYLSAVEGESEGVIIKESNKSQGNIPPDKIYTLTYDKKSQRLYLGYNQGIVISCDRLGGNVKQFDFRHKEAISSISIEGDIQLVASLDKTASVWRKGKLLKTLIGHKDALYNVSFIDGTNYVLSSGEDSRIKIWDLSPTHIAETDIPGYKAITKLKYDKRRNEYIVAYKSLAADDNLSYQGKVLTYDPSLKRTGDIYQDKRYGNGKGYINTFDYKGDILVMAGNANQVVTTAQENRSEKLLFSNITSIIHDIKFGDSTIYIATTKGILYRKLNDNTLKYDTLSRGHRVNALSFTSEKNLLAAAREDGLLILYQDQVAIDTLHNHTDKVSDVDFSGSGKFLASGGWDNKVFIWDLGGERPMLILTDKHLNDVRDIEFYKDSLLLAGGLDRTVKLYRSTNGKSFEALPSLISHNSAITAATFGMLKDSAGVFVLSGDINGNLRQWNISGFQEVIASRTFDKIKADRDILKKQNALKGTWISMDNSKIKSYPDSIVFNHHPDFSFFCSKNNTCIWKKGQQKNSWNPFVPKNLYEGKYSVLELNQLQIKTADTTIQYFFQLLPDGQLHLEKDEEIIAYKRSEVD